MGVEASKECGFSCLSCCVDSVKNMFGGWFNWGDAKKTADDVTKKVATVITKVKKEGEKLKKKAVAKVEEIKTKLAAKKPAVEKPAPAKKPVAKNPAVAKKAAPKKPAATKKQAPKKSV